MRNITLSYSSRNYNFNFPAGYSWHLLPTIANFQPFNKPDGLIHLQQEKPIKQAIHWWPWNPQSLDHPPEPQLHGPHELASLVSIMFHRFSQADTKNQHIKFYGPIAGRVSTQLDHISQLFTQGGKHSHSQHAVTQTTGIRQDMVATHESNPKEAIGRERHGKQSSRPLCSLKHWFFPSILHFSETSQGMAGYGRSVWKFLRDDVEGFPNHSGIAGVKSLASRCLKPHSSMPSHKP